MQNYKAKFKIILEPVHHLFSRAILRYFETGRFRFCEIRLASGSEKPEDRRNVAVPTLRRSEGFAAKISRNGVGEKMMNRL